ncbi:MAG: MFS transporter [Actinobacteria bacterium]|nr:MFS transporter [Actinomycetota bacterium]
MTADTQDLRAHHLRRLVGLGGFRRLLAVRYSSQAGDGMFQLGAATLLLFTLSPDKATSASEVAGIIAVTTLPFTLVGPFAGVVIDRWRRQRILVWTNVVRVLVVALALPVVTIESIGQPLFLAAVLVALSVNRFLLATLGAVLPRVVPGQELVPANAIAGIGGSLSTLVGAVLGSIVAELVGEEGGGPELAVVAAMGLYALSALAATRMSVRTLGPELTEPPPPLRHSLGRAATEFADGVRMVVRTRRAWAPIAVMSLLRGLGGLASISALLVFRNLYGGGPGDVGLVLGLFGAGAGVGALLLPAAERRFDLRPESALRLALLVSGIASVVFAPGLSKPRLLAVNLILGAAFAFAKIATDTLVQGALPDRFRGRVFAAYDVLYNAGFLGGALVGALTLTEAERAEPVLVAVGLVAIIAAVVTRTWLAKMPPPVDVETWDEFEAVTGAESA